MPVTDFHFQDGVFYAREQGDVDAGDAQEWADHVLRYASECPHPIAALIDARSVKRINAEARQIFAHATNIPNLSCAVVVTGDFKVVQNARMINMLSDAKHTHIFTTMDEAVRFLTHKLQRFNGRQAWA